MAVEGIDVSHWQGNIDWKKVAEHKKFAGIKGTDNLSYIDPKFLDNRKQAEDNGLYVLEYHFNGVGDGGEQAAHFINTVGSDKSRIKTLDFEAGLMSDAHARKFADYVNKHAKGEKCLYASNTNCNRLLAYGEFKGWLRWVASWDSKPSKYDFWQTSGHGHCPGVSGECDLDEYVSNFDDLKLLFGGEEDVAQTQDEFNKMLAIGLSVGTERLAEFQYAIGMYRHDKGEAKPAEAEQALGWDAAEAIKNAGPGLPSGTTFTGNVSGTVD